MITVKDRIGYIARQSDRAAKAKGEKMIKRIIHKLKHRRFCKLNNYFCPDCIYHDFVWDGITFRGNRCRYPK